MTIVQAMPTTGDPPERLTARELDAEWVYDLGYARGVREAMATFRAIEQITHPQGANGAG